MADCDNEATEQFVWCDIDSGIHHISRPHCEACSAEAQPAETVTVLPIFDEDLLCQGPEDC